MIKWLSSLFHRQHKYSNDCVSYWQKFDGHEYPVAQIMSFDCLKCGFHYFAGNNIYPEYSEKDKILGLPPTGFIKVSVR